MLRILAVLTVIGSAANAGGIVLRDWSELPPRVVGHGVSLTTTEVIQLQGKLLENRSGAFLIDVSKTSDAGRFPKGKQVVLHEFVTELAGKERKFSFKNFAGGAVVFPLLCLVPGRGLAASAERESGGAASPGAYFVDTLLTPGWLGWLGVGAAITPIVTPIGYLRGTDHFDYTVR